MEKIYGYNKLFQINFDMKNHDDKKSHKLNRNLPLKILVEFGKNILAQNVFKRDRYFY